MAVEGSLLSAAKLNRVWERISQKLPVVSNGSALCHKHSNRPAPKVRANPLSEHCHGFQDR